MASINKVILLGNLGKDPVTRVVSPGKAVTEFSLATRERYKDKNGETVIATEWHNIVAWSPIAEIIEKYLKKGSQVYLEGKIESRTYEDKDGIKRYRTDIKVKDIQFLGSPLGTQNSETTSAPGYVQNTEKGSSTNAFAAEMSKVSAEVNDDLPF